MFSSTQVFLKPSPWWTATFYCLRVGGFCFCNRVINHVKSGNVAFPHGRFLHHKRTIIKWNKTAASRYDIICHSSLKRTRIISQRPKCSVLLYVCWSHVYLICWCNECYKCLGSIVRGQSAWYWYMCSRLECICTRWFFFLCVCMHDNVRTVRRIFLILVFVY